MIGSPDFNTDFVSDNVRSTLDSDGYRFEVSGVDRVRARSRRSGPHTVTFRDTAADDHFYVTPNLAVYNGPNAIVSAAGFETAILEGDAGGNDQAVLIGTEGADDHFSNRNLTRLTGVTESISYRIEARGIKRTITRTKGGADRSTLQGLDKSHVYSTEGYTYMSGESHFARVEGAESMLIRSEAPESRVIFDGSNGNDDVYATPSFMRLLTPTRWVRASGFDAAIANRLGGGYDFAQFVDSDGDDRFSGAKFDSWMRGSGFFNRVVQFERVHATASSGNDVTVSQETGGDDYVYSTGEITRISADDYFVRTRGFDYSSVIFNGGGFDIVKIVDTVDDDSAYIAGRRATVHGNGVTRQFDGMNRVVAISENGGRDEIFENDIEVELIVFGDWV